MDLEEERQSGDQLMDRIDRGREQVHSHTPSTHSHYQSSPVSLTCYPASHRLVFVPSVCKWSPVALSSTSNIITSAMKETPCSYVWSQMCSVSLWITCLCLYIHHQRPSIHILYNKSCRLIACKIILRNRPAWRPASLLWGFLSNFHDSFTKRPFLMLCLSQNIKAAKLLKFSGCRVHFQIAPSIIGPRTRTFYSLAR